MSNDIVEKVCLQKNKRKRVLWYVDNETVGQGFHGNNVGYINISLYGVLNVEFKHHTEQ